MSDAVTRMEMPAGPSAAATPRSGDYTGILPSQKILEMLASGGTFRGTVVLESTSVAEIERKRQAEIEAERARNRELSRKSRGYDGPSFGR